MLKNFARASGRCAELEAIYQAPRSWTERAYRKLNYFNEVDKGGHFTAGKLARSVLRGDGSATGCPYPT
jgi:hypothetical protein